MSIAEDITPAGRKARWDRWARKRRYLYVPLPRAPVFVSISRGLLAPRSLRIGDPSFDRSWRVFGTPEDVVRALLTPDVRQAIANCPGLYDVSIAKDELTLYVWYKAEESSMLALADLIAAHVETLGARAVDVEALTAMQTRLQKTYRRRLLIATAIIITVIVLMALAP